MFGLAAQFRQFFRADTGLAPSTVCAASRQPPEVTFSIGPQIWHCSRNRLRTSSITVPSLPAKDSRTLKSTAPVMSRLAMAASPIP